MVLEAGVAALMEPVDLERSAGPRVLNDIIKAHFVAKEQLEEMRAAFLDGYTPVAGTFRYLDLVVGKDDLRLMHAHGLQEMFWRTLAGRNTRARAFLCALPTTEVLEHLLSENGARWPELIHDRFDTLYFIAVLNTLTTPELRVRFARFLMQTIFAEPLGFAPTVQARWARLLSVFAEPDTEPFGEAFRLGLPEATRSIKVAVLISGQIRQGFGDVIKTLQRSLPDTVSADLVLSTWDKTGRSKRAEDGEQKVRAEDEIAALGLTGAFAKIDIEDENGLGFSNNQEKQHYKLWRTFEQAEELGDYDLYLRMRPDLLLETPLTPEMFTRALQARQGDQLIWGPAALCARTDMHEPYIYVSDNFALAQPAAYRRFAHAWNNLERVKDQFGMNAPRDWYGHVSIASSLLADQMLMRRFDTPLAFKLL